MAWGNVLVFRAQTTIREAVAAARARDADFAIFRDGDDLFAFRRHELEDIELADLAAFDALELTPWKKSLQVSSQHAKWPTLIADPLAPSSLRFVVIGEDGEPLHVEEPGGRGALHGGPRPWASSRGLESLGARAAGTQAPPTGAAVQKIDPQDRGRNGSGPAGTQAPPINADLDLDLDLDATLPHQGWRDELRLDGDAFDDTAGYVEMDAPRGSEDKDIVRYPAITASDDRRAGATLLLRIDLSGALDPATDGDPIRFTDLPDNWRQLAISVVVSSPQLELADGANEGTILVRRDLPSVACVIPAIVKPEGEQRIDVTAIFSRDDRWCGTAQRTFTATGDDAALTTGMVSLMDGATPPDLTIHILRDTTVPGRLHWLLAPATAHRLHVDGDLRGETSLGDPATFVRALFAAAAGARLGEHTRLLRGIGETLWERAPASVRAAYWQLRDELGDGFSIQLLTDEPSIPWELMRPVRAGSKGTRLLAETHPIARGLLAYPNRLRAKLPADGARLTLAPDYHRRPRFRALDEARDESEMLQDRFGARAITPGTARSLLQLLEQPGSAPVQLLHFAGHGELRDQAILSSIALEDTDVRVAELRRQDVVLGEHHKTFVIFNACDVGATGDALGAVAGWAEAFAHREFSGFLAPLWAIFDGHARLAMERFLDAVLVRKQRIGEALRDVRRDCGEVSATFLSYIYYGDVNARFG